MSGAGGGTAKGSIGKYYHLKQFSDSLKQFNIDCKLVKETDYVVGFPTKHIQKFLASEKKFEKLIREFKPDVVFTDAKSSFGLKTIKLKIPLFVLLRGHHWSQIEFAKNTIYKNFLMKKIVDMRNDVAERVMANATALLPICNYLVGIVKQHHPHQSTGVFVEGIDSSNWKKTKGMKLEHPCVGLLQDANWWRKTREMLILEKVLQEMPEVNFYWAGDGQYKDKVLSVLEKHKNFHSLGSLQYPDQVRDFLSEIDVYALITGMDLAPLTLKEAQLMEKPVIATNVGGNPEMMEDKNTGYLVEEGNAFELKEKISTLLNNKELRIEMGRKGRKFIEENFSLEASAKNFLKIIETYLKKKTD